MPSILKKSLVLQGSRLIVLSWALPLMPNCSRLGSSIDDFNLEEVVRFAGLAPNCAQLVRDGHNSAAER